MVVVVGVGGMRWRRPTSWAASVPWAVLGCRGARGRAGALSPGVQDERVDGHGDGHGHLPHLLPRAGGHGGHGGLLLRRLLGEPGVLVCEVGPLPPTPAGTAAPPPPSTRPPWRRASCWWWGSPWPSPPGAPSSTAPTGSGAGGPWAAAGSSGGHTSDGRIVSRISAFYGSFCYKQ